MLTIHQLTKQFDGNQVLKGVSLTVNKGDVIAVIGQSGGGKTTLLRCMNFLETADSGTMEFDGEVYDWQGFPRGMWRSSAGKPLSCSRAIICSATKPL